MELRDWNINNYNLSIKPVKLEVHHEVDGTPYVFYEGELTEPNSGDTYKIIIPHLVMEFDQLILQFSQKEEIFSLNDNKCYLRPVKWKGATIYFLAEKVNDELFDWGESNGIF